MLVVLSDFYEQPETVIKTVEPLRFKGNELILFHVLDPQEIQPSLSDPVLLVDMETQEAHRGFARLRQARIPREGRRAHRRRCASKATSAGMDYFLLRTDRPLDDALREYLTIRQGRM